MTEFQIKEQISLPATYSVNESSEEARNQLATYAAKITAVIDPLGQEHAVGAIRAIKAHISAVATARTSLSRPLDSAKALLIQLERDHIAPLVAEQARLERLLTAFDQREKARVAAADEMRRNEIARKKAELNRATEVARAAEESATNEVELDKAISAEIAAQEALSALYRSIAASVPAKSKIKDVFTGPKMEYEVTDVVALYAARPDLCRLEPNASAIRAVCVPELPVPGLKMWWTEKTTVRK